MRAPDSAGGSEAGVAGELGVILRGGGGRHQETTQGTGGPSPCSMGPSSQGPLGSGTESVNAEEGERKEGSEKKSGRELD